MTTKVRTQPANCFASPVCLAIHHLNPIVRKDLSGNPFPIVPRSGRVRSYRQPSLVDEPNAIRLQAFGPPKMV
jgi:hypothetical protein